MKRYLFLGSAVIFVGVCLSLILNANSANEGHNEIDGMVGAQVEPEQLRKWLNNKNDAIYEINKDSFYIQEEIGSQGVSLTIPKKFYNDFIVKFSMMSVTKKANIKMITVNTANGDTYSFEIRQRPKGYRLYVHHNGHNITQSDGEILEANVFYGIMFEKRQNKIALSLNDKIIWEKDFPEGTGRKATFNLLLSGLPDHPAGITIKDMEIYSAKK